MNNTDEQPRHVLIVRPWLGTVTGGGAYAHFDALVMREATNRPIQRYGDYDILSRSDDGRKTLRLEHFRFQCQIDDRQPQSYAWEWGYQPSHGTIFSLTDLERFGPSITAIQRTLDRFDRDDGPPTTVGRFVVRLARALKLEQIPFTPAHILLR